jgi:hypothetical protein
MTRRTRATVADIARALKAVLAAGVPAVVEIKPTGEIVIKPPSDKPQVKEVTF